MRSKNDARLSVVRRGPLGSGDQYWAWVHLEDLVGLILLTLERGDVQGPINAVAPRSGDRAHGGA